MTFDCHAQRLLNPFRGIINTVRYQSAEAVTADGVHWDIYVSNESLQLPGGQRTQVSDMRFGKWSAAAGLRRGPRFPSEDFKAMEALGTTLYEHLLTVQDDVPFPFTDCFELWLLDKQDRPLALLDSAADPGDIDLEQACEWRPGLNARQSFTSPAAATLGLDASRPGMLCDYLARYVNSRTADRACAQLFERQPGQAGRGLGGINLDTALNGRRLPALEFPVTLLETHHHDDPHRQLLHDFICWQAPWLLLLPTLDADLRRRYEQHARAQALKLAGQYHLYPAILDQELIDAARIEARLRQAVPEKKHETTTLYPFYMELEEG